MSNDNIDDIMNQKSFSVSDDESNREQSEKPKESKQSKKKSKADKFSRAASENLGIMSEFTGSDSNEKEKKDKKEKKEKKKKVLPKSANKEKNAPVADEELEKINKKELERATGQYEDGSKKSLTVIGVIVIMLLLIGSYFYFFSASAGPIIMLSNHPIQDVLFTGTNKALLLKANKPVYFYFSPDGRLGYKKIYIKILKVISSKSAPKKKYTNTGSFSYTLDPSWRKVSTHFQNDYVASVGDYVIQILDPTGKIIANQSFQVQ